MSQQNESGNTNTTTNDSQSVDVTTSILDEFAALKEKYAQSISQQKQLDEKLKKYEEKGRQRRIEQLDSQQMRDFVDKLIESHKEMSPYTDDVKNILGEMKETPEAQPMVEFVSCAASMHASSTKKFEELYQENKKLREQIERLTKPALMSQDERFTTVIDVKSSGLQPSNKRQRVDEHSTYRHAQICAKDVNKNLWEKLIG